MDNTKLQEILNLSRDEKIELVQTLWNNITEEKAIPDVPEEHILELKKRLKKIDDGTAKFVSWDDVQKKFGDK